MIVARVRASLGPVVALARQRAMFRDRPALRSAILILMLGLIPWWQFGIYKDRQNLDFTYRNVSVAGQPYRADYAYFFHYLDLYPVTWRGMKQPPGPDERSARDALAAQGHRLHTRIEYDNLSIFSYLPDIWLGGDPRAPTSAVGDGLAFTLALMAVYLAFWAARYELLGIAVVALAGSNPFQLYEVYARENVFSWAITASLLVMALMTPLLACHRYAFQGAWWRRAYPWLAVLAAGAVLGSVRHVRTEFITTLPLALIVPFFMVALRWRARAAISGVLLVAFLASQWGWTYYFRGKIVEAQRVLLTHGGRIPSLYSVDGDFHPFWFSFWAGLGDFDTKYGYLFDDNTVKAFVNTKLGRETSYDLSALAESDAVLRKAVLGDIARDPAWFADILARRVYRAVAENTPPQVAYGARSFRPDIPATFLLPLALGLVGLLVFCRRHRLVLLALFPLASGGSAVLVTTIGGMHHYAWFHLFVYAYVAALAIEGAITFMSRVASRSAAPPKPSTI